MPGPKSAKSKNKTEDSSALSQVGIGGPGHLREALTNCTDPLQAIEEFQEQNGILLPSLKPALPFLDLHGVQRLDFHQSVMEELRDRLLQRVGELAIIDPSAPPSIVKARHKILNDLLIKSFPAIKSKALRPVVMCIMQHLPRIKPEYLSAVMADQDLYKEAAVEVKQQIWQDNQALFGDEVSPLLTKYIQDKEKALFGFPEGGTGLRDTSQSFFSMNPRARRQKEVVQQLVKMVGQKVKLYDMVLQFLRTLFLRTRNIHYCTLRAELLMALHDLDVHEICSVDPCHKFTWCLDACIRERFVDSKRAKELQGFLDGMRRGQEQVLGDLSMILCDPHAINTLALSTMKALQQMAATETLPRHNSELLFLLRLMLLGMRAWQMIDSQVFKEIKLDSQLVTRFLPCMTGLMVDDQFNLLSGRFTEDILTQMEPVSDYMLAVCHDSTVAATTMMYYVSQAAHQRDVAAVCRGLPVLAAAETDIIYQDTLLHLLVAHLPALCEHFSSPGLCRAVFDQFFMPSTSQENVVRHLLRLLWSIHHRIQPEKLDSLMDAVKPTDEHSEALNSMYGDLSQRIVSYQPSPTPEPEKLDSPLMNVPAPTPAHP